MFAAATATVSGQSKTQPCKPGQLDPGLKECRADQRQVDQGLLLVHSDYRPRLALVEQSRHDDAGGLAIAIGLEGASGDTTRDGGQLHFRGGHTTVTAFRHVSGERRFEAHQRAAQLRLLVGEEALAQQLRALRPAPAPRWSDADIARLESAYALMQEQMAQELTLDYLCAQAHPAGAAHAAGKVTAGKWVSGGAGGLANGLSPSGQFQRRVQPLFRLRAEDRGTRGRVKSRCRIGGQQSPL